MVWTNIYPVLVSGLVAVVAAFILRWIKPKAKIIWSETHIFCYLITPDDPDKLAGNLWTRSMFVQNVGKETAEGVEIIFNFKPQLFNLWPSLPHTTELIPDKRFVIRANSLAAKEWFRIELLSEHEPPDLVRVRTASTGEALKVDMVPTRMYPKPILFLIVLSMYLGAFSIIYHTISYAFMFFGS